MPISSTETAYIQDLTVILHKCNTGCSSCSGTSSNCLGCYNVSSTVYYKSDGVNECSTGCSTGYWEDDSSNLCRPCD